MEPLSPPTNPNISHSTLTHSLLKMDRKPLLTNLVLSNMEGIIEGGGGVP